MNKKNKRIIQITTTAIFIIGACVILTLILRKCVDEKRKQIKISNIDNIDLITGKEMVPLTFSATYDDGSYILNPTFSFSPTLPNGIIFDKVNWTISGKIENEYISEKDGDFKTYKLTINDEEGIKAEKQFGLRSVESFNGVGWEGVVNGILTRSVEESSEGEDIVIVEDSGTIEAENLVIPDFINNGDKIIPVTKIKENAFSNNWNITGDLTIGNNVTEIGEQAFRLCQNLNGKIILGEKVKNIGLLAFWNCLGLKGDLIIPESVETIGSNAFALCIGLDGTLTLGNKIKTIRDGAFWGCKNLTGNLTIPKNIVTIEDMAFFDCENFTSLTFSGFDEEPDWGEGIFTSWKDTDNPKVDSTSSVWTNQEARDFAVTKGLGLNWVAKDN